MRTVPGTIHVCAHICACVYARAHNARLLTHSYYKITAQQRTGTHVQLSSANLAKLSNKLPVLAMRPVRQPGLNMTKVATLSARVNTANLPSK